MNKKKKIMALIACMCVIVSGTNVYAANIGSVAYNITVSKSASNDDYMSKRCIRTEDINDFDVTPTYFNTNNASFWAKSNQLYGNVTSRDIYVENGLNECRYGNYTSTAPTDVYYYMSTWYGYSATGVVKSKGYYRP